MKPSDKEVEGSRVEESQIQDQIEPILILFRLGERVGMYICIQSRRGGCRDLYFVTRQHPLARLRRLNAGARDEQAGTDEKYLFF